MLHAKHKQLHRDARPCDLYPRVQHIPRVPAAPRAPATRPPIPSLLSLPNRPGRLHANHRQPEHHLRPGGRPQRFLGPNPVIRPPVVMHQMPGVPVARGKRFPAPFLPRGVGQSLLGLPPVQAPLRNAPVGFMSRHQPCLHRPCLNKEGFISSSQRKRDSGHVATGKSNSHMTKSKTDAKTTKAEIKREVCGEGSWASSSEQTEPAVKKLKSFGADEQVEQAEGGDAEQTAVDTDSPAIPEQEEEESVSAEAEADLEQSRTAEVQGVGTSLKVTIQRSSESRAFSTGPEDKVAATGRSPDKDTSTTAGKFCCYICNITCPDQQEFQAHMISLDHQQKMMEIQHLSNTCLATLLPKMQYSLQSSHREKRQGLQHWCAICQSHFAGDLIEHRRTKKHKVAKVSSRPFCTVCERYFRTPRKFVEHMKSPEHKQQVEELREEGGPEVMEELITVDAIGCFEGEDDYEEEENEDKEEDTSPEKVISEMMSDCEGYDPDTQYGASFVVPAAGFLCKLCHKFYHFESSARETHCKSLVHYQNLQKYKAVLSRPREGEESLRSSNSSTPIPEKSSDTAARTQAEGGQEEKSQSLKECLTSCHDSPSPEREPTCAATLSPAGTAKRLTRKANSDCGPTAQEREPSRKSSKS
ncbi:cdkn1a interacting zinc finger protein 1b isoform X2 [Electrophorus electricus]|uniref:cdkn1a interacting zinc finger protein 1b isoform X2 n=1 Tax=Electrophorus electricus TaxID=8005 RepID=UPI0015D0C090|nr:cdkn1a interacting zinc finger protein 1b isoform X2 [Electrophorus electricus]